MVKCIIVIELKVELRYAVLLKLGDFFVKFDF